MSKLLFQIQFLMQICSGVIKNTTYFLNHHHTYTWSGLLVKFPHSRWGKNIKNLFWTYLGVAQDLGDTNMFPDGCLSLLHISGVRPWDKIFLSYLEYIFLITQENKWNREEKALRLFTHQSWTPPPLQACGEECTAWADLGELFFSPTVSNVLVYIFFPEMPVVHKEFTHELLTPKKENLSMAKEHMRKRWNMNKQTKKLPIFTIFL